MLPAITSTLRHFLGVALGAWVSSGLITGEQASIVAEAVITVSGVVMLVLWSVVEKKLLKR